MKTTVVDVFCGAGGLSYGFVKEKFEVAAGIDVDVSCKYPYEANVKAVFIQKAIEELSSSELNELYGDSQIRILVGCAPCQPFSAYNKKRGKDEKWKLLYEF